MHFDPAQVEMGFLGSAGLVFFVLLAMVVMGTLKALPAKDFVRQISKLVLADNVERAVKLCGAGEGRPVALLVRVGLRAVGEADMPIGQRVERAKMVMIGQLPGMQAPMIRDVVIASILGLCVFLAGGVTVLLTLDAQLWALPAATTAVVDVLAVACVAGRLKLRDDLAQVVTNFGRVVNDA